MAYATFNDVLTRYRPLSTMVGTHQYDVTSVEVASVFISGAEGIVNGFLARRYVVPLTPATPPLITMISADLAIHAMLAEKLPQIPEWIDKRYERCMELLKWLAEGEMVLSSVETVASGDNYAWSATMDHHPVFDPVLSDMQQVPDQQRVEQALFDRADDLDIDDRC